MARKTVRQLPMEEVLAKKFDIFSEGLFERSFVSRVGREIVENLNPQKLPRNYQLEALGRFDFYVAEYRHRVKPTNLLFHMATGSGKTLIMAANILQMYRMGYRNFIFFVNSTNIIRKTKQDFLDPNSSKYLFASPVRFDGRIVKIREVSNFDEANTEDINIVFTTTQGLHTSLNNPKENAVTYQDFNDRHTVLISDETHHLNALTKVRGASQERMAATEDALAGFDVEGLNGKEEEDLRSWEGTVRRILESNPENILLEYTATIEIENENIFEKYKDKMLLQYDLRAYCKDRYSKDVDVVERDLPPLERALQAVVVSQYKRKVAAEHGIDLKPVILFKANRVKLEGLRRVTREDIGSFEFRKDFSAKISSLTGADLEQIKTTATKETIFGKAFAFFEKKRLNLDALADEIRLEFADERCLSVNDDSEAEKWQVKVNTLEDPDNGIRAIFSVEKLNEGWDVLNLFDIVRLYNPRDAKANKPGKTTISEAQLIGRGARYFPFTTDDPMHEPDRRKFDGAPDNELRVIEQLHYHSAKNPEYIQELRQALVKVGIDLTKTKKCPIRLKPSFKQSRLWKKGVVYVNERQKIDRSAILGFSEKNCEAKFTARIHSGQVRETRVLGEEVTVISGEDSITENYPISAFTKAAIRKAIDRNTFFYFDNLKKYFPNLHSISQFIDDGTYLGCLRIEVVGPAPRVQSLPPDDQVDILISVLSSIEDMVKKGWTEYVGTKKFVPIRIKDILKEEEKVLQIAVDETSDQERGIPMSKTNNDALRADLSRAAWFPFDESYGTSVEKRFIKFIEAKMPELEARYSDICLFRNEKEIKLFRFSDGRATEPDFVLFMRDKSSGKDTSYQVFVESKGAHLIESDQWKEDFLRDIEGNAVLETLVDADEYRVMGMPFFTEAQEGTKSFGPVFRERFLIGNSQ
jgi:type III restriction enzyme